MIKQRPTSMARVVFAFVLTVVVALLPITVVAAAASDAGDVISALTGYRGQALWIAAIVVMTGVVSITVSSALRRRPRAARV